MTEPRRDDATNSQSSGGQGQGGQQPKSDEQQRAQPPSPWEWAVGALGALVTLATIVYMVWQGMMYTPAQVPDLTIRPDSVVHVEAGWLVVFSAENHGRATAAGVAVAGTLRADSTTVEERHATMDYVPARSTRGGGILFSHDPRRYRLELRAEGYQKP